MVFKQEGRPDGRYPVAVVRVLLQGQAHVATVAVAEDDHVREGSEIRGVEDQLLVVADAAAPWEGPLDVVTAVVLAVRSQAAAVAVVALG
jgi:hypothetical protein